MGRPRPSPGTPASPHPPSRNAPKSGSRSKPVMHGSRTGCSTPAARSCGWWRCTSTAFRPLGTPLRRCGRTGRACCGGGGYGFAPTRCGAPGPFNPPGPPDRCSTGPTSCWAPTGPSTPLTGHLRRSEGGPGPAGPAAAAARVPERPRRTAPRGPPPAGVAPEVPRQQLAVPLESQPRPRGPADLVRRGDPMGRRPRPATCPRVRAEGRDARADLRGRAPHAPGMAHGPPLPALHALDVRRPRP